jgi:hypothetical protein
VGNLAAIITCEPTISYQSRYCVELPETKEVAYILLGGLTGDAFNVDGGGHCWRVGLRMIEWNKKG